jgi:hypothetical protein
MAIAGVIGDIGAPLVYGAQRKLSAVELRAVADAVAKRIDAARTLPSKRHLNLVIADVASQMTGVRPLWPPDFVAISKRALAHLAAVTRARAKAEADRRDARERAQLEKARREGAASERRRNQAEDRRQRQRATEERRRALDERRRQRAEAAERRRRRDAELARRRAASARAAAASRPMATSQAVYAPAPRAIAFDDAGDEVERFDGTADDFASEEPAEAFEREDPADGAEGEEPDAGDGFEEQPEDEGIDDGSEDGDVGALEASGGRPEAGGAVQLLAGFAAVVAIVAAVME